MIGGAYRRAWRAVVILLLLTRGALLRLTARQHILVLIFLIFLLSILPPTIHILLLVLRVRHERRTILIVRVAAVVQSATLSSLTHQSDDLLDQIIIGFAHLLWNVTLIHSLSELIGLDHPIDTTNALPSMDLHLECIPDILPSLGHLSNLLRKGVKPDSLQEQLSIRVLGPIPTLLLHPLESLGLVHHLKELLQ